MNSPSTQPRTSSGSKWVSYDPSVAIFPRKPSCYVVYLDGALSYVGQTTDLAKRISAHKIKTGYGGTFFTKWGEFKSVTIKARFSEVIGDWAMREIRLIDRLKPSLNIALSSKKRGCL